MRFLLFPFAFRSLACLALLFTFLTGRAQNFEGQWKGSFSAAGSAETDEYMLELQVTGKTQVSGYSYTYFYDEKGTRYFTICKVSGKIDLSSKTVTVTETEKIKGDVPPGIMDCLQTHTLTYFKGDDGETLEGKWKPAPGFDHGCGFGMTTLSRKILAKIKPAHHSGAPLAGRKGASDSLARGTVHRRTAADSLARGLAHRRPTTDSLAHKPIATHTPPATHGTRSGQTAAAAKTPRPASLHKDTSLSQVQSSPTQLGAPPVSAAPINVPPPQVRQRTNNLIQTVDLTSPEIRIELYDDGIIDHDTVTVYFNGKAVVYKNMLTHQPIRATLTALPDRDNDLILYADNLGDIPPNTALMIVYAGGEQYDIRVTSDLSTNGMVRFRLKQAKSPQ
jgi:hypothetical protein